MKRNGLRYGLAMVGVLVVAAGCGETEKDSHTSDSNSSSGMDSGGTSGSGGGGSGPTSNSAASSVVTNGSVVTTATVSGSSGSTGGASGVSTGTVGSVSSSSTGGAGGAGGLGGASGAGGAPPITECLGCELGNEDFGQDCNVWVCLGPGEGMQRLDEAGCMDLFTQVPRYCCPPDVELDCSP